MTEHPPPESVPDEPPLSPWARPVGWLLVALPIAGLAVHAFLIVATPGDLALAYVKSRGLFVVAIVGLGNLAAVWALYRRTGLRRLLAARILTYLWLISSALLLGKAYPDQFLWSAWL